MPPGLISSAAPGKKAAAPKAAPRRRAAAVPSGPAPSAAGISSATTNAAPPTPNTTQPQSLTSVFDGLEQQEEDVRPRESEVELTAKDAAARSETVAEDLPPPPPIVAAEAEVVERAREVEPVVAALPTPESTQTDITQRSGVEAERRDASEEQRQDDARLRVRNEDSVGQDKVPREAARQAEAGQIVGNEEPAVKARHVAEPEAAARQGEANVTTNSEGSTLSAGPTSDEGPPTTARSTYVPPSASSAIPAAVDPTTLAPPRRPDPAPKPNAKRPRPAKSTTAAPRPRKKTKLSSARSNAKVQAVVNGEGEAGDEGADVVMSTETDGVQPNAAQKRKPAPKKTVIGRKRKEMSTATIQSLDDETEGQAEEEAGTEGGLEGATAAQPAPKKQRKPRAKRVTKKKPVAATAQARQRPAEGEGEREREDGEANEETEHDGSDPELHEIDPNSISMWELSRDEYHGKRSERGKKMAEIDWNKVAQDRRDAADALVVSLRTDDHLRRDPAENVVPSVEGPNGTAEPEGSQARRSQSRAVTAAAAPPTPAPANDDLGLGFVLDADGNIVADENTMTFTRDAAAQAAANTDAPIEEINDLTQTVNRFTHLNANRRDPADRVPVWKSKSDPWSEDETDKFYDALRMFGTDFFIISKMFAPKTRRMIKNKFNREEKLDPNRITRALTGIVETPMSLEHYSRETGFAIEKFTKYDGVKHAQNVIDSENAGKEVVDEKEMKRREKEAAKEEREKEKEREKEERKAKRKARTKKGIAEAGGAGFGGGGPIEDVVGGAE